MRSENIILKDDLASLLEGLEKVKRESKDVVQKPKPKINNSDITNLFSDLEEASKEAKVLEKKRKDYVETTPEEISNLFKGLEEVSKETKAKTSHNKIKPIKKEVKPKVKLKSKDIVEKVHHQEKNELKEVLEEKKPEPKKEAIIEKILSNLDDTRYTKEQIGDIDGIEVLRRDFEQFKRNIATQISDKVSTSSGGGAGSFSDLDDVDPTTAKVDGKVIQYDGSSNKFVGGDLSTVGVAGTSITGNTLASGVTASSLTSVGTLTSLTVDNVSINGATIGHTDDTDLITLSDGSVTIAGNLTVSGTTTTVNQTVVNVTDAFVFEGANADAHETTFRVDEPTADRKASLQDKTGTIALLSGFKLDATDGSASNEGDFLVLNTAAHENDRLLFEDGTSDPIAVLASHGITLTGQGWNAFRFDNT